MHRLRQLWHLPFGMENPNLFVITGGPGSGKTTVLLELQKRGFRFAAEVARQIIQEQVRDGGSAVPWGNRERYTSLMLQRSIESYLQHTPAAEKTFADRGIPDSLCYARLIRLEDESKIREACDLYRYAKRVFLAPAWREIYETDTERKQDVAEAVRTAEVMARVYEEYGYEVMELPKASVAERADFILKHISQTPLT